MSATKYFKGGDLKNKLVIDQKASIIGKIEDTVITEEGKLGLLVKYDGVENIILYDQVKNIDDVVLLRIEMNVEVIGAPVEEGVEETLVMDSIVIEAPVEEERVEELGEDVVEEIVMERVELPEEKVETVLEVVSPMASNICSTCGMANRAGMNFCTKCGASLK